MIGLDTNVLVRFLVQDDPAQARAATAVLDGLTEAEPGFIGREVLVELFWVLRSAYGFEKDALCAAIEGLATSVEIVVENAAEALAAMQLVREEGADFADALVVSAARRVGCEAVPTFDRRAVRLAGMRLIEA